jgi:hypothetical protein
MATLTPTCGIATRISSLDRGQVIHELLHFKGRIRLDFTKEYLGRQSIEWLRHVLLAACLKAR